MYVADKTLIGRSLSGHVSVCVVKSRSGGGQFSHTVIVDTDESPGKNSRVILL